MINILKTISGFIANAISNYSIGVPVVITKISVGSWFLFQTSEGPWYLDQNPGFNPNHIGKYHKHEDGSWWEYDGDLNDPNFDPYWERRIENPQTLKQLDMARDSIIRLSKIGDVNSNGVPDIHEGFWIKPDVGNTFNSATTAIRRDPLTLDLDGDGIETTAPSNTNPILFDATGNGIKTSTGWIKADDGLLVLDRNANGYIDNGLELFGDSTRMSNGAFASDGFEAIRDVQFQRNGMRFAVK